LLDIRLLGPPDVAVDGAPIEVDTRKAIALVAYLAVEGAASRDSLATLFWAESSTDRARATLRRTLSSLRSGVGAEAIEADRSRIALTGQVTTDIGRFDQALAATATHEHETTDVCARCIPHLALATDLYRGDFLAGFSVRDAPEFEDWARIVAESLRLRAGEAFHRLAMARAAGGDYPGAISAVTRWIDLDPLHEPAHRLIMLLNGWAGDRPGAVEAYRGFVAILDQELGVPPLEETTELYEAILDEDLPPAPGVRRRVKAEPSTAPVVGKMLNREAEFNELRRGLASVSDRGQVIALTGAGWMGKTRLIEEFSSEVSDQGLPVLMGRAFRMEQTIPYGVATQVLRAMTPFIEQHLKTIPEWALAEVSRLAPLPGENYPRASLDRFGELRLLESVYATVEAISAVQPLLIVIDDLQWVDPASASLISYLARRISDFAVVLLVAARSGELLPDPVADLTGNADITVDLLPLTAEALASRVGDQTRAADVIRSTGGVPLLVLEAISGDAPETEIRPGVARYLDSRLRDASELGRQVLTTASVLTGICDASLLQETSGRSDVEVVEAVEELIGSGLLREMPESDGLTFTLDTLEEITYDSISLVRRRLLHRRAAEALETRPRSATDPGLAGAIATQYRGAGDPRAAVWYLRAGDLALGVYAHTEARDFYETAIALGSVDVGQIRLTLGEIALTRGDYPSAMRELTTAASQSEGATLGLVEHRLGVAQRLLGRFPVAIEHFERSREHHPVPADLYSDWALLFHRTGDTKKAREMGQKALAAIETTDNRTRARVLNVLGVVTNDPEEAMTHLDQALELAGNDDLARMAALNNKAFLLAQIGNTDAAIRLVEEAIGIASKTGHRHREAALRNHLADLYHGAGQIEQSQQALTEAVAVFADIETGGWEPEVWLLSRW